LQGIFFNKTMLAEKWNNALNIFQLSKGKSKIEAALN
jgi:hypothetical protein